MQSSGVVFLDHTADVGIGIAAPTLDALFHRAAIGMLALLRGEDDEPTDGRRTPDSRGADQHGPDRHGVDPQQPAEDPVQRITLTAATLPSLLADWLREILFLHEIEGRDYVNAEFETLESSTLDSTLRARVRTTASVGAVREIKGVTYHELRVDRNPSGWEAQVIFDV